MLENVPSCFRHHALVRPRSCYFSPPQRLEHQEERRQINVNLSYSPISSYPKHCQKHCLLFGLSPENFVQRRTACFASPLTPQPINNLSYFDPSRRRNQRQSPKSNPYSRQNSPTSSNQAELKKRVKEFVERMEKDSKSRQERSKLLRDRAVRESPSKKTDDQDKMYGLFSKLKRDLR
jgi:hypothetical protein